MNKTLLAVGVPCLENSTAQHKFKGTAQKCTLNLSYLPSLLKSRIEFFGRLLSVLFLLFFSLSLSGEGSIDFINYNGYRLFYSANVPQQLKVYAAEGEFINVGASHLGITGGYMEVFRPDGSLHSVFDNTGNSLGLAIIYNDVEEKNGPTGGGTTMGGGYVPGVIPVEAGEGGIWSVTLMFPDPTILVFDNLMNNAPWTRENDQPTIRRGVLAWDVTVSQGAAGNEGGNLLIGRVFSREHVSVVSKNGNTTSPQYYILTSDGFQYRVRFEDTDPWNFPLISNTFGLLTSDGQPSYSSQSFENIARTNNFDDWLPNTFYLYEPQAEDVGSFVNNKIFFNPPDPNMPSSALTTDIFRQNTYVTWLYTTPPNIDLNITDFVFTGENSTDEIPCPPSTMEQGGSAYITFNSTLGGTAVLMFDFNSDGDFEDPEDRTIFELIRAGNDTIRWDGLDGTGNIFPLMDGFTLNYELKIRGGETHILMSDVENNLGGVTFELLNEDMNFNHNDEFYYDHSAIEGAVSGGGEPGKPLPTTIPFTYSNNFGNEKMLDYWTFLEYGSSGMGTFNINLISECEPADDDSDGDGVKDIDDLDDDNDGVPDRMEFCLSTNDFSCLPNGLDPSGDEDGDGVFNYKDVDNATALSSCPDENNDGICDELLPEFDTDQDGVPNHLDLDSDHDGISDLQEAGHGQADLDANGIIDGEAEAFGLNGFFNTIASDPDALDAIATYTPWDKDSDAFPDYRDLDSDNDGINDVEEAGFGIVDMDDNGRIDSVQGVGDAGLAALIDPVISGQPIPPLFDTDGDDVPDWHDLDSDNDGINDVKEAGYGDADNDGIIGEGMVTVNFDGQAIADIEENPLSTTSMPPSFDSDLVPDYRDLDSDNDGINDVEEAGLTDLDNNGILGEGVLVVDEDGQGTEDQTGVILIPLSNPKDQDSDGLYDFRDLDSDNDGINDVEEAGLSDNDDNGRIGVGQPVVNDQGQAVLDITIMTLMTTSSPDDKDRDGVPNYNDLDSDNDGIYDVKEAGFTDLDDDGIEGIGTPQINETGQPLEDSVGNELGVTSEPDDTDLDEIPDYKDLDSDNDGINDVAEANGTDSDNDGILGAGMLTVNYNGIAIIDENDTPLRASSLPKDKDGDEVADFRDLDSDNDGINDVIEGGNPDGDNDGLVGTGAPMVNEYGQPIGTDGGTPIVANSFPPDTDGDNVPDYNDLDSDNDAINDVIEGGNEDADNDGIIGMGMPTINEQGQPTVDTTGDLLSTTSNPTDTDADDIPDFLDLDSDGDGISDVVEGGYLDPDNNDMVGIGIPEVNENGQAMGENSPTSSPTETDGDGMFDFQELDSDNDGLLDEDECPQDNPCRDGDEDGMFDFQDVDRDDDGILDEVECPTGVPCVDTDDDGDPDVDDLDSDDDTLTDAEECPNGAPCPDEDNDMTPDFQDPDCLASGTLPIITNISSSGSNCSGGDMVLSADNTSSLSGTVTYTWTGPNDFSYTATAPSEGPFSVSIPNADINQQGSYTLVLEAENGCTSSPESIVVDINAQPQTPILSSNGDVLCGGENLELFANNYQGDVIYSWFMGNEAENILISETSEPNLIIPDASMDNAGTYYVTVNVNGCLSNPSNLQLIEVVDAIPVITNITSSGAGCTGEDLVLTANNATNLSGSISYTWIGPNGFNYTATAPSAGPFSVSIPNADVIHQGSYTLILETQSGCTSSPESIIVAINSQPQTPTLSSNGDVLCGGENLELFVNNYQGDVTYSWYMGDEAENILISETSEPSLIIPDASMDNTGTYYVTVNVNGCLSNPSNLQLIEVVDAIPIITNLTSSGAGCTGEDLVLSANNAINLSGSISYTWIGPNDFIYTATAPSAGPFSVSIPNADVIHQGSYTLILETQSGCTSSPESIIVAINSQPQTPILSSNGDVLCGGENLELFANNYQGDVTYSWYMGNEAEGILISETSEPSLIIPDASMDNTGTYYVTVNVNGCLSNPSNLQLIEVVDGLPIITNITSSGAICTSEDLVLSANNANSSSGSITYRWIGPNNFNYTATAPSAGPFSVIIPNIDVSQQGSYTLILETQGGCTSTPASVVVDVNQQPETPILSSDVDALCPGESIELLSTGYEGNVSYSWFVGDELENIMIEETIEPSLIIPDVDGSFSDTYFVIVTVDGCASNPSNLIPVEVLAGGTDLQTTNSSTALQPACVGSTVELSVPVLPGATYQWVGPNAYTSNLPNAIIEGVTAENAGEYFVLVSQNGCTTVASMPTMVYVLETVDPIISGGGSFCENSSVSLSVVNDLEIPDGSQVSYQWIDADTNIPVLTTNEPSWTLDNINVNQSGNYYLSVMLNDCPVNLSNTVAIEVTDLPDEQALIVDETTKACGADEVQIEAIASNRAEGQWSTLSGASIISPTDAQTAVFDLDEGENTFIWTLSTANCGTFSTDTLKIINAAINLNANDDLVSIENTQAITHNLLSNDDISDQSEGVSIRIINPPTEGIFSVNEEGVINYIPVDNFRGIVSFDYEICSNSCPDICSQANVQLSFDDPTFAGECFVPNVFTPNDDNMNDAFAIYCLESEFTNNRLMVFNRWGDIVFEQDSYRNDWEGTYQDKPLPPGTYFYMLYLDRDKEDALRGFITLVR